MKWTYKINKLRKWYRLKTLATYKFYQKMDPKYLNQYLYSLFYLIISKDLSIWSDQNWSEFGKQFNKSAEFPLPGRTGIIASSSSSSDAAVTSPESKPQSSSSKRLHVTELITKTYIESILNDNLYYLLSKPTAQEHQASKLKEALGAFYYQDKMQRATLSIEEDAQIRKRLELRAYNCPISLVQGV